MRYLYDVGILPLSRATYIYYLYRKGLPPASGHIRRISDYVLNLYKFCNHRRYRGYTAPIPTNKLNSKKWKYNEFWY